MHSTEIIMQAELQTQQPAGHSSRSVEGYFAVVKQHNSILATTDAMVTTRC